MRLTTSTSTRRPGHLEQWGRGATVVAAIIVATLGPLASEAVAAPAPGTMPAPSPAPGAPPANVDAAQAQAVTLADQQVGADGASDTVQQADPVPSCTAGQRAAGTLWWQVTVPKDAGARIARLTFAGGSRGAVLAWYATMPVAGAELVCARTTTARQTRTVQHLLKPGLTYILMVGSAPGAGITHGDGIAWSASFRGAGGWAPVDPLPARVQGPAAADGGAGSLLAFGGLATSFATEPPATVHSADVARLDAKTGRWSAAGKLPIGLSYARAARVGSRIYLPGGQTNAVNGAGCVVRTHVVWDLTARAALATPATEYTGPPTWDYAVASDGTRGYWMVGGAFDPTPCDVGGRGISDRQLLSAARRFDAATGAWTDLPPLAQPREGAVAAHAGGLLVVAGGFDRTRALASVEVYDPARKSWARTADMPVPVYGATGGVGQGKDGRPLVFVAGGWTSDGRFTPGGAAGETDATQVYDVRARTWRLLDARLTPRESLGGAVAGGRLYAIGGFSGQPVRAVERFSVDAAPPVVKVTMRSAGAGKVTLRARATDPSGVVAVRWKVPGHRRAFAGQRLTIDAAGAARCVAQAVDGAGNVGTGRLRRR